MWTRFGKTMKRTRICTTAGERMESVPRQDSEQRREFVPRQGFTRKIGLGFICRLGSEQRRRKQLEMKVDSVENTTQIQNLKPTRT
jgi:hypothetical protein